MRKIKFRAWSKTENRYLSQKEMNEAGGFYYNNGVSPFPQEFDLQQFVGRKDKNGKEIYEGDILSWVLPGGRIRLSVVSFNEDAVGYRVGRAGGDGKQHAHGVGTVIRCWYSDKTRW